MRMVTAFLRSRHTCRMLGPSALARMHLVGVLSERPRLAADQVCVVNASLSRRTETFVSCSKTTHDPSDLMSVALRGDRWI